jgi:hypothetical protein
VLTYQLGPPVMDATGAKGRYEVLLEISVNMEQMRAQVEAAIAAAQDAGPGASPMPPRSGRRSDGYRLPERPPKGWAAARVAQRANRNDSWSIAPIELPATISREVPRGSSRAHRGLYKPSGLWGRVERLLR